MKPQLHFSIVVAASVLALAACGAQPGETHPVDNWATSYCSALTDWVTAVDSISRGFVNEPSQSTTTDIADLETVAKQVSQAGRDLTDALSRAGSPQSPNAAQVDATVAALSSAVKARSDAATHAAKSNDQSALAGFRRLQAFTTAVNGAFADLLTADAKIRTEDATLGRTIANAHACRDFRSDVRNGTHHGDQ